MSRSQVSSPDLVRDVLINKQDEFSGRPFFFKVRGYMKEVPDVIQYEDSPERRIKKRAMHGALKM